MGLTNPIRQKPAQGQIQQQASCSKEASPVRVLGKTFRDLGPLSEAEFKKDGCGEMRWGDGSELRKRAALAEGTSLVPSTSVWLRTLCN